MCAGESSAAPWFGKAGVHREDRGGNTRV